MKANEIDTLSEILHEDYYCLADEGDLVDGYLTVDVQRAGFTITVITRTPSKNFLRWRYRELAPGDLTQYTDAHWSRPVFVEPVTTKRTITETTYEPIK